jgi:glycosyltransferase involved in cell wall biosynthesis
MGNLGVAESRAKESLSIIPNQAFANFILGEVYSDRQNFADAYQYYQNMRTAIDTEDLSVKVIGDYQLAPEIIAYKIGKCLVGLKMWNEALKEFETGLKINPSDISCHVGAANVAFHFKKFDLSKELLDRAHKMSPDNNEIRGFLSQVEKAISNLKPIGLQEKQSVNAKILLSLSMIVKNEENYLPGCLDSVKGLVDEIVIVDTGSSDSTIEIARKYGAIIIEFPWNDDFAAARNESLRNCSGEWILYLDADERLTPDSAKNLRNYLLASGPEIGGIICTIESDHLQLDGKTELHRGGYPRVFRNLGYPLIKFEGRVHEQITHSILDTGKSFMLSDITIEHLGYNQSREVMEAKVKRNYRLLLQHVQEEPLNSYAWYQLGQTLAQMRLIDQAEDTIRFAVGLGNLSKSVYASAAATLAQLTGNKKKFEEALHWAELSIEKAPEQVYAYHLKAYALLYMNRLDEAIREFGDVLQKIRKKRGVPLSGFDIEIPEELVHRGLDEARKRKEELKGK